MVTSDINTSSAAIGGVQIRVFPGSCLTNGLTICGVTSPTKPTIPTTDVIDPTVSAVPMIMSRRNLGMLAPIDAAVS